MSNKEARYLHRMFDRLVEGKSLYPQEIAALKKTLPELPKQKTLEEIAWDMHFAWSKTLGNDWKEELFGDLDTWLSEQHTQLRDHLEVVKSEAVPGLPAGMRLADHEEYGRVVVSPSLDIDDCYEIYYLDPGISSGTDISGVEPNSLTFINAEPAHPEFLETEEDYENAPEGTIVACDGENPCHKLHDKWLSFSFFDVKDNRGMSRARRRVLRLGWGE